MSPPAGRGRPRPSRRAAGPRARRARDRRAIPPGASNGALHPGIIGAGPDDLRPRAATHQEIERVREHGLAGAGLAGDRVEARRQGAARRRERAPAPRGRPARRRRRRTGGARRRRRGRRRRPRRDRRRRIGPGRGRRLRRRARRPHRATAAPPAWSSTSSPATCAATSSESTRSRAGSRWCRSASTRSTAEAKARGSIDAVLAHAEHAAPRSSGWRARRAGRQLGARIEAAEARAGRARRGARRRPGAAAASGSTERVADGASPSWRWRARAGGRLRSPSGRLRPARRRDRRAPRRDQPGDADLAAARRGVRR